jgi:hypothetical protein
MKPHREQTSVDQMMMTVRADGTTLASEFSCLILDNASIHNDEDFILKMKTHIHVMFIPPYCYHPLTPRLWCLWLSRALPEEDG